MKLEFFVRSDGDPSVGIWGMEGKVTIEDNFGDELKDDKEIIEYWRKAIADQYPDEVGLIVQTKKEIEKENEYQRRLFE